MPDSFQNPIGGGSKDPFEKYRIERIQRDKETRNTKRNTSQNSISKKNLLVAYIIHLFKKVLDLFEEQDKKEPSNSVAINTQKHLTLLKTALETLKMYDLSQDSLFLNKLSNLWHLFLEDILLFRRNTPLATQMRLFVKSIQAYPETKEHSLGYYLSEYAGQKWLPFPYMEMIRHLWSEHQKSPLNSHLFQWCEDLDSLIKILESNDSL